MVLVMMLDLANITNLQYAED